LQNALQHRGDGDSMTQAADEFSMKTWWERIIGKLPYFYVSTLLWAMAVAFYWVPKISYLALHVSWLAGIFHPIGESLIVAGVLVLLIDPFLKERLLKEASKGIFHYLLGFDHEPEIQNRLKELVFKTTLLRKNYNIKCILTPENDKMRLDMDISFEVFNPTAEGQEYIHAAEFEKVEEPKSRGMSLISEARTYSEEEVAFKLKDDDIEVLESSVGPINIEPSIKNISYKFSTKVSLLYPLEFFHAIHVGTPTIGMYVEIIPPKGFRVTSGKSKKMSHAGNIWEYRDLFMPGEHVNIRWEKIQTNS
jgi:hypothetical protein